MADAVTVFLAGLGGVFSGMALLYVAIRATSFLIGRLDARAARRAAAPAAKGEADE